MKNLQYIMLVLLLVSCGARKTQTDKQDIKTDIATEVKEETAITTETVINTVLLTNTDNWVITPIDNDKPVVITDAAGNTTTLNNARFERKKEKTAAQVNETEKKQETVKKEVKQQVKQHAKTKQRTTDRDAVFGWSWLWFLVLAGLILFWWFVLRKKK